MYGLTDWPKDTARKLVLAMAQTKGVSDAVAELLSGDAEALIAIAIPGLTSDSPLLLRGAVTAISRAGNLVNPEVRKRASEHIVNRADDQTNSDYAAALGALHEEQARSILWSFVDRRVAREQSLIALTWIHAPADLSRLAQLALLPANRDTLNHDVTSLPYALHRGYGEAAFPYLETMLRSSEFTWVGTNSARELVVAGRPTGFRFMVDAIENNKPYRGEMLQYLRDQFPDLRRANEPTILTFVKGRQ